MTRNTNALPVAAGQGADQNTHAHHVTTSPTKKVRVLEALKQPGGLNRFEAERIGDHCLNSTIAELRAGGVMIESITGGPTET
jgi:hypothetical protein